jgi:hypothetical protein
MNSEELQKHVEWMQYKDLSELLSSEIIPHPWFPAFRLDEKNDQSTTWFSALVPLSIIPKLIKGDSWDFHIGSGYPSVWTHYEKRDVSKRVYCVFGNEEGIEPLVIQRNFHGIRDSFFEVSQEFSLYHNLYHDAPHKQYLYFDDDGEESGVIRYSDNYVEIKTDLLLRFCAEKQMALALFIDSFRHSKLTLSELGLEEKQLPSAADTYCYHLSIVTEDSLFRKEFQTMSRLMGKKYILPGPAPSDDKEDKNKVYQEFIIGTDPQGKLIKHTCDSEKLANYFGKNPGSPHYLTPVFFRLEVLSKYYANPQKYSVSDGLLSCGGLWSLRIDNDHTDCVVVWLGDLGTYLSENARNYWLSFNIPPGGRRISETEFRRAILAIPTDPKRPDLVFKHKYMRFQEDYRKVKGWDFFLPLHADDAHLFTGLHLPSTDNQSEFDTMLLALTKIIVDSINEKEIGRGLITLAKDDKGITKIDKFFREKGLTEFESRINFLRVLQNLRSEFAAHRKGSNYEKLVKQLQLADEGQQRVFGRLLNSAIDLIEYLRINLLSDNKAVD